MHIKDLSSPSLVPDAFVCQSVVVCMRSKESTEAGKSIPNTTPKFL